MKAATGLITPLIIIIFLISCATTTTQIPEKYDLDIQFLRVDKITDLHVGREKPAYVYNGEMAIREYMRHKDDQDYQQQIPRPLYASNFQISKVDEQSLILRGGPDKNYLLVLQWPIPDKLSDLGIKIITSSFCINAKTDFVLIGEALRCPIERIYMIGDDEHAVMIKNQLLGKPKTYFPSPKRKHI